MPSYASSAPGLESCKINLPLNNGTNIAFVHERLDLKNYKGDPNEEINKAIVLGPGWTESCNSFITTRHAFAYQGMSAITISHASGKGFKDSFANAGERRAETITLVCEWVAENLGDYSLAGHSLGGIDATRAIIDGQLEPEALYLLASAGLLKLEHMGRIMPLVLKEVGKKELQLQGKNLDDTRFVLATLSNIIRHPIAIAGEAKYVCSAYVGHHLSEIAASGILIANIMGKDDDIFPYKAVKKDTKKSLIDCTKVIDNAGHNFHHYQADELASIVVDLSLRRQELLEKRKSNPKFIKYLGKQAARLSPNDILTTVDVADIQEAVDAMPFVNPRRVSID